MSLVVRSQLLASTGKVIEGTTTARLGNLSFLWGAAEDVEKARSAALRQLGATRSKSVCFRPIYRDIIVDVDETYGGIGMGMTLPLRADAVVTRATGVGLFLLLADCQGVSFYDPRQGVVALAHCGRHSTNLGLAAKVIGHMTTYYGSRVEDVLVYLGPSIAADHYVFGEGIRGDLQGWGRHIERLGEDRYRVDIRGYNIEQLRLAGVASKHIENADTDTYSSPDFFSHVRHVRDGAPAGRFGTFLALRSR